MRWLLVVALVLCAETQQVRRDRPEPHMRMRDRFQGERLIGDAMGLSLLLRVLRSFLFVILCYENKILHDTPHNTHVATLFNHRIFVLA